MSGLNRRHLLTVLGAGWTIGVPAFAMSQSQDLVSSHLGGDGHCGGPLPGMEMSPAGASASLANARTMARVAPSGHLAGDT